MLWKSKERGEATHKRTGNWTELARTRHRGLKQSEGQVFNVPKWLCFILVQPLLRRRGKNFVPGFYNCLTSGRLSQPMGTSGRPEHSWEVAHLPFVKMFLSFFLTLHPFMLLSLCPSSFPKYQCPLCPPWPPHVLHHSALAFCSPVLPDFHSFQHVAQTLLLLTSNSFHYYLLSMPQ